MKIKYAIIISIAIIAEIRKISAKIPNITSMFILNIIILLIMNY
jgi:hypothetical protein